MDPASSDPNGIIAVVVVVYLAVLVLGQYVAHVKNRPAGEAFALAGIFGPFGVLILALLPTIAPGPVFVPPTSAASATRKPAPTESPIAFPGPARKSGPPRV